MYRFEVLDEELSDDDEGGGQRYLSFYRLQSTK
jgi:hypothetical protein